MNVDVEACEEDQDTLKGMFKCSNNRKAFTCRMVVDFDFKELENPIERIFCLGCHVNHEQLLI